MSTNVQSAAVYQPCELGRYAVGEEQRVLIARTVDGELCVYDRACGAGARPFFVAAGFESDRELAALLRDYRDVAQRLGICPMSAEAIGRVLMRDAVAEPTPPQDRTP